jgi:replicative DNA helicase
MTTQVSFGTYGKAFQEKIMQALLVDRHFAEQMLEVFDVQYFELKYLQFLADRYFGHAKKYKVFPTLQLLVTIIRDELKTGTDIALRDQIIDYMTRVRSNPDPGDLAYVKEKALDFCRKQALKQALENAVDQMQADKYEQIVEGIKKAVCVGTTPQLGHDFFQDYESRFTRLQRNCVATGIDELDRKDILNGGLGAGELGVIVAPTGVGKCVFSDTYVQVRYEQIIIDGRIYAPGDRVVTRRGLILVRDVREDDELL